METMSIRCHLVLILVGLLCCCCCCCSGSNFLSQSSIEEVSAEKLAASYEKINAYLEKTVPESTDPKVWMREIETMLHKKQSQCISLGGKSLVKTLKMLVSLSELELNDPDLCEHFKALHLFHKLDSGLSDGTRWQEPHYRLHKLDHLIEHYAFQAARKCARSGKWPTLGRALKQTAYDYIDYQLVLQVPDSSEIEPNMAAAERMLSSQINLDGAVADTLRLFISLKSGDSCNEEGFERLLKNDLAIKGESHPYTGHFNTKFRKMRRIDLVILRYITKHAHECGPKLRNKIFSAISSLDADTYRKVLGLTSTFFVSHSRYEDLVDSANQKAVDADFTLPLAVSYAQQLVEACCVGGLIQVDEIEKLNESKLRIYVNTLMSKDPNAVVYGANGKRGKVEQKRQLVEILDKYLFTPCAKYLSKLDTLIEMDEYSQYADAEYLKSKRSEFISQFNYHMARAADQACRYVDTNRQSIINDFKNYATKTLANGAFFWTQK